MKIINRVIPIALILGKRVKTFWTTAHTRLCLYESAYKMSSEFKGFFGEVIEVNGQEATQGL